MVMGVGPSVLVEEVPVGAHVIPALLRKYAPRTVRFESGSLRQSNRAWVDRSRFNQQLGLVAELGRQPQPRWLGRVRPDRLRLSQKNRLMTPMEPKWTRMEPENGL
jgi:hypothetical protein